MPRGGKREGAGRKPSLEWFDRIAIGASAHNLLKDRARADAEARLMKKPLVARALAAQLEVEKRYRWSELRAEALAQRRQELSRHGYSDAELDEIARNTVVTPPPGMDQDMERATQAVFKTRKRGYSEPLRRPYGVRGKHFENNVLEQVADEEGVSLRMVEACLNEYRAFLKYLVSSQGYTAAIL